MFKHRCKKKTKPLIDFTAEEFSFWSFTAKLF